MPNTEKTSDISEDNLAKYGLLDILLLDKTSQKNIIWATDSYENHKATDPIEKEDIVGDNNNLIQPRISKTKDEQKARTKSKAEVFTPKDIVDKMNKQVDSKSKNWPTDEDSWKDYVGELRLEITCGEAPFIVGRYNAANGEKILELSNRVGFLDRKLRVVSKYCDNKKDWYEWAKKAFQCSYGYEWQGDNLLLARENLLYSFIDYWNDKFRDDKINLERKVSESKIEMLKEVAEIISWNIFQMDGLKYVIPMSCHDEIANKSGQISFFDENLEVVTKKECPGCTSNNPKKHNGCYVKIMDWSNEKTVKFVELF